MKKKCLALLCAVGLTICLAACGDTAPETQDSSMGSQSQESQVPEEIPFDEETALKEIAIEVTDALSELISCDAYMEAMSSPQELQEVLEGWRGLKIDQTRPVCVIPLGSAELKAYLESMAGQEFSMDGMSDTVKEYLLLKTGSSIGSMLNARLGGTVVLAASSVANYTKTYVPKGTVENQIWLMPASDTVSFCVTFSNTGNGVLTASATYVVLNQEMRDLLLGDDQFSTKEIHW